MDEGPGLLPAHWMRFPLHHTARDTPIVPVPGLPVVGWALEREPQTWAPDLGFHRDHPGTGKGPAPCCPLLFHPLPSSPGSLLPPLIPGASCTVPFPIPSHFLQRPGEKAIPTPSQAQVDRQNTSGARPGARAHCSLLIPLPYKHTAIESLGCTKPCVRWGRGPKEKALIGSISE